MNVSQITNWKGEISRRDYFLWGIILFAVKYNLDRLTALYHGKSWYFTDYFIQADKLSVTELSESDKIFYLILLLQSLPFIWFGTLLCVKRLRSATLASWLVIFFFIPFLNFVLFVVLCAIPERDGVVKPADSYLRRMLPQSKYGSALFALAIVSIIALALTAFFINTLKDYGWSLFVGIPFFLGFGSVLIYGSRRSLKYKEALGVALASLLLVSILIFILAFEGIICIAMGFPIMLFIAWIGATIGFAIHGRQQSFNSLILTTALVPVMGIIETTDEHAAPTSMVTTEIIINAPQQTVWNELVAFSEIEEPTELLFKTGIAYPTHAEIDGTGVGAIRKCNFTTGPFIEPITIWNEPTLLQFGVLDQPPPMVEWSLYKDLKIAHLEGYFKSTQGQFKLEPTPDGKTKLSGTTWYNHSVWPSFYWRMWSDYILHQIHRRVLTHIKIKSER